MKMLERVEFAENPEPRCPCVLLLDSSGSMAGDPIAELNKGIRIFKDELCKDTLAARRVELCIITYGYNHVQTVQDFITVDDFRPLQLSAGGFTPMGEAIELALQTVEFRKKLYKSNGIAYYQPWIFLITDGEPTDDISRAQQMIHEGESKRQLAFFAVGVEDANMETLALLTPRKPLKLKGLSFKDMFVWLSQSLSSVSHSNVGDKIKLPARGWDEI